MVPLDLYTFDGYGHTLAQGACTSGQCCCTVPKIDGQPISLLSCVAKQCSGSGVGYDAFQTNTDGSWQWGAAAAQCTNATVKANFDTPFTRTWRNAERAFPRFVAHSCALVLLFGRCRHWPAPQLRLEQRGRQRHAVRDRRRDLDALGACGAALSRPRNPEGRIFAASRTAPLETLPPPRCTLTPLSPLSSPSPPPYLSLSPPHDTNTSWINSRIARPQQAPPTHEREGPTCIRKLQSALLLYQWFLLPLRCSSLLPLLLVAVPLASRRRRRPLAMASCSLPLALLCLVAVLALSAQAIKLPNSTCHACHL